MIEDTWQDYVDENKSRVEQEISLLSLNQRKVLLNLSRAPTQMPFGKESVLAWSMSNTSIHRTMLTLLEKDYVEKGSDGYYLILDPLYKSVLS